MAKIITNSKKIIKRTKKSYKNLKELIKIPQCS